MVTYQTWHETYRRRNENCVKSEIPEGFTLLSEGNVHKNPIVYERFSWRPDGDPAVAVNIQTRSTKNDLFCFSN